MKSDTLKKSIGLIIKVDPFWTGLSLAFGPQASKVYSAAIEKFIGPRMSLQLTTWLIHYTYSYSDMYNANEADNVYVFAPQLRYYFGKPNKHRGIYAGIFADIIHENDAWSSYVQQSNHFTNSYGAGIVAGIQYYISPKITIELLGGIAEDKMYDFETISGRQNGPTYDDGNFTTGLLDINLGYRF